MILTITMNPSIDVSYPLDELVIDSTNRTDQVSKTAGGKGLNVTRVLHQLGVPVTATGVLGGNFGDFIKGQLDKENIHHDFSSIDAETRSCIAILHEGNQTEILESGPEVSKEEQRFFLEKFEMLLKESEYITISGSLTKGFSDNFYSTLIEKAKQSDVRVLLDTSGVTLKKSIESEHKPYLIKPNEHELSELVGRKINSEQELIAVLKDNLFSGIEWIVVSLGEKGALVKYKKEFYRVTIPVIETINPVGSGDSTIAGLAYALYEEKTADEIMKIGMVAGMLNAQEKTTGHINVDNFEEIFNKVTVNKVKSSP